MAIDPTLVSQLKEKDGQPVILAVSPNGRVRMVHNGPQWHALFARSVASVSSPSLSPDLNKLDLTERRIIPLGKLRATGYTVGDLRGAFTITQPM